jgi:hypothetical protein
MDGSPEYEQETTYNFRTLVADRGLGIDKDMMILQRIHRNIHKQNI